MRLASRCKKCLSSSAQNTRRFLKDAGWSRKRVCDYLYEITKAPPPPIYAEGGVKEALNEKSAAGAGALASPEAVVPIVAGGDGGGWSMVIPMWATGTKTRSVTKVIKTA